MQSKSDTTNTSPGIELISISMVNTSNGLVRTYDNCVVSSSIENLYLDAGTADVNFVFGSSGDDGERVPAHKNLLSITSDVFRAMFYGEWKVSGDIHMNTGHKEFLQTAPAFKEFLQYFYLKSVTLTAGNVAEVMGLGHRYNVANCFKACLEFISDSLSIDNVCIGYALAILYEQTELKMRCERMIILNTSA
ncbi:BTB/POZ domain-containing protein 6-like, partial [Sitodiplosis mosellana]|uniref:BTB/POZ domain-containing protein 6-like n=1 Tax=Sitodiplosis mosellana TaxID=263140 RepID=UPI0024441F3F